MKPTTALENLRNVAEAFKGTFEQHAVLQQSIQTLEKTIAKEKEEEKKKK